MRRVARLTASAVAVVTVAWANPCHAQLTVFDPAIGDVKAAAAASALQPSDRTALTALRRVPTDDDSLASEPTDQTRKLAFLKSGPEKEIL